VEVMQMPTKNQRINVVFDESLYGTIKLLAKRDSVSLSTKVRDLVIEALEYVEDITLTQIAAEREKSFDRKKALSGEDIILD
jgi:predicted DNA-binding protein